MENIRIETHRDLNVPGLNRRRVDVWLPEAYDSNPDQAFPVLYMQDGQTVFDQWKKKTAGWEIHKTISRLAEQGKLTPPIVVAISSTLNRAIDYTPAKALNTSDELPRQKPTSDQYIRWIAHTLKPAIDHRYRTLKDPANTALMGSSLGALLSLYALCEFPATFGKAACLSTHWPAVGEGMLTYLETALPEPGQHQFYFDHGSTGLDADYGVWQHRVDNLLRQKGYREGKDFVSWFFEGEDHTTNAWRARVHIPLAFLFGRADY